MSCPKDCRNAPVSTCHSSVRSCCTNTSSKRRCADHMNRSLSDQCCCCTGMASIYHREQWGRHSNQVNISRRTDQCTRASMCSGKRGSSWHQTYSYRQSCSARLDLDTDKDDRRFGHCLNRPSSGPSCKIRSICLRCCPDIPDTPPSPDRTRSSDHCSCKGHS